MKIYKEYIESENQRIALRYTGTSKDLILLVHGAASDSRIFYRQLRLLGENYTVAALDLPGHGRSKGGETSYESYISAIEKAVQHFEAQSIILGGHSFGSALALAAGSKINNIKAYILFSPAKNYLNTKNILQNDDSIEIQNFFSSRMYSKENKLMQSLIKRGNQLIEDQLLLKDLDICFSLNSIYPEKIHEPVFSCACSGDEIVPAHDSKSFTDEFPNNTYKEYISDGHVPFIDCWEQCNSDIIEFLESI